MSAGRSTAEAMHGRPLLLMYLKHDRALAEVRKDRNRIWVDRNRLSFMFCSIETMWGDQEMWWLSEVRC